jgi:FkbM family methyltransferase
MSRRSESMPPVCAPDTRAAECRGAFTTKSCGSIRGFDISFRMILKAHSSHSSNTTTHQEMWCSVGEAHGQAPFYEYDQPYVNALAPAVDVNGRGMTRVVEVVTIDDLCEHLRIRPTFIRMDVQGAEFQALRGARRTISAAGSRLTIVAEMHPQCWPSFGIDAAHARETIDALGLSAAPLEPGADVFARDAHAVLRPRRA